MGKRGKIWAAVFVCVALAAPAVVIARGGTDQTDLRIERGDVTYVTGERTTNSKDWKTVPGLGELRSIAPQPTTVSVQMKKGRAAFRLDTGAHIAAPGSITSGSKGFESFTFVTDESCNLVKLQWHKVGGSRAVLSKASVLGLRADLGCG